MPGASDGADADAELDEALAARACCLAPSKEPVFFLTSEPDAPAIGYGGSGEAKLIVREDPSRTATPVRVLGRLHLEAYVPDGLVECACKRTLRSRAPRWCCARGDRVGLVEPRNNTGVHRIAIRVSVADQVLGPLRDACPQSSLGEVASSRKR